MFGIIGSILYFPAAIADQTGQVSSLSPPIGITCVEIIEAIVGIGVIILGALVFQEKTVGVSTS